MVDSLVCIHAGYKVELYYYLWTKDMEVLKDTLKPFDAYLISNAQINLTPEAYRVLENPYQLYLTARTSIEDIPMLALIPKIF